MNKNNILQHIEEQNELLQTPYKLSPEDKEIIEKEMRQLKKQLSRKKYPNKKRYIPERRKTRLHMRRDKSKRGYYHWQRPRAKRFLKKMSNKKVRHSHLFSHKGAGYKKCFDLPWALW